MKIEKFTFDSFPGAPGNAGSDSVTEAPKSQQPAPLFTPAANTSEKPAPPQPDEPSAEEKASMKAFQQGFEEGFQKGMNSKTHERDDALLKTMQSLQVLLKERQGSDEKRDEEVAEATCRLVQKIIKTVFPAFAQHPVLAKMDLTSKVGVILREQQAKSATLCVHPSLVDFVDMYLKQAPTRPLSIKGDGALLPGDCRLDWQHGGVEMLKTTLLKEVMALLDGMTGLDEAEGNLGPAVNTEEAQHVAG